MADQNVKPSDTIRGDFEKIGNKEVRLDELIDRIVEADKRNHGVPLLQNEERAQLQQYFSKFADSETAGIHTQIENGQLRTYVSSQFLERQMGLSAMLDPRDAPGTDQAVIQALQKCENQTATRATAAKPAAPKGP